MAMPRKKGKCIDCGERMPRSGCCEPCKAQRRRLAKLHQTGDPDRSRAGWREAHLMARGRGVPNG